MSQSPSHDDVPQLEPDETVPPRPEEEMADVARSEPDHRAAGRDDQRDR
ncbi:hypothetical protein [uncultured Cellulomonas sp.]|nr:hypothetical protein [uncultured Cellulomonas sp.]